MEALKQHLAGIHQHLTELEEHARKLENKNFADIVASAKGRVHQLTEHPDLELVAEKAGEGKQEPDQIPEGLRAEAGQ